VTFFELINAILTILPNAQFDADNEGQLIIYTNVKSVSANFDEPLQEME